MFSQPTESSEEHEKSSGWSSARQRLSRLFGIRRRSKKSSPRLSRKLNDDIHSNRAEYAEIHYHHHRSQHQLHHKDSSSEMDFLHSLNDSTGSGSDSTSLEYPSKQTRGKKKSSSSSPSTDDEADSMKGDIISWREWFLSKPGHSRLLLKIPDHFLMDEFNFSDLVNKRPHVRRFLTTIIGSVDRVDPTHQEDHYFVGDDTISQEQIDNDEFFQVVPEITTPVQLYLLLHVRYLKTREGLLKIAKRYSRGDFGVCPRFHCSRERLIPIGLSDLIGEARVQRYCPSCNDIYHWTSEIYWNIDGAAYGTSFPHIFFFSFPSFVRQDIKTSEDKEDPSLQTSCTLPPLKLYEPKIFGFKLLPTCSREFVSYDGSQSTHADPPYTLMIYSFDAGVGIGRELRSFPNFYRYWGAVVDSYQ